MQEYDVGVILYHDTNSCVSCFSGSYIVIKLPCSCEISE